MHSYRGQVSPEMENDGMTLKVASDKLRSDVPSKIRPIVWKEITEQRKPRRRSLDNILGDGFSRSQRNKEDIIRESLRQVIMKHKDWNSYITSNSDYIDFISNWSCHWWCWRLCCPDHKERHFFQLLDDDFLCALHYAILYNNLHVCESLLRDKKCDVNVKGINHETVLHMYARRKKWSKPDETDPGEKILHLLFEVTPVIEINALDIERRTPLHHAVKYNDYSYVKWLIDHGADVTKSSRFNETPLHLACSLSSDVDSVPMIEMLLYAADPMLKKLMLFSNANTLSRLQRRYANIQDANGKTPLCRAAEKKHVESIKLLLQHVENDQWETTLVSAIKSGNCIILNIIFDACNRHLTFNIPILHLACKLNNGRQIADRSLSINEKLVSTDDDDYITGYLVKNLNLNLLSNYNKEGYTPILLATHFGFIDCVKYLISTSKNVEQQLEEVTKDRQYNIFHICTTQERQNSITSIDSHHLSICNFIFSDHKHIANRLVYGQDSEGNTPLHLACKQGDMNICEFFVKNMDENIYLFMEDFKQCTPLHICAKFGNHTFIKILLPSTIDKKIAIKALNESQDIDGRTPLHLACIEGNMEVIKCFIEEFNASFLTHAENLDTPFLSACEYGHLDVVNYFLEVTDIDTTIRNSKGLNALDMAIINHREIIVRRLLCCNNWRRLMENAYYDESGVISTPMRELIIFMPDIAYELINTKLTIIKGNDDMTKHQVIYDYTLFEDQYHIRNWMYGDDYRKNNSKLNWFTKLLCSTNETTMNRSIDPYTVNAYTLVRNHPLHIIAKCKQMDLMQLDYCTRLGMEKFKRFGLILFSIFFSIYALFVLLYTFLILGSKHPFYYYNLFNQSSNGTLTWDYGFNASICEEVGIYLLKLKNKNYLKSNIYRWSTPILYLLLIIFVIKNICVILFAFPRIFRKMNLYFETLALILCFMNIYDWYSWQKPLDIRCPIQWELGSIGLLFSWLTILTYMRYIPWMNWGLYVVMMQVIFSKFLKCIPVLLTLICGFGFTYYMLLQYQTVYGSSFEALMRTAISLYDLGYEARLYTPIGGGIMLYPVIYFVFILSEITLTIIVTNLLIGLAVGEIPTLKTQAKLNRNIIFYEMLFDYEFLHMQLKLFARCLLRRIRYGEFPFCCCRCDCPAQCNAFAKCICCECAVRTRDYTSRSQHRRDKFFLSRWLTKIDGWLVEKEIQSAITYQKEWKKKHKPIGHEHDD